MKRVATIVILTAIVGGSAGITEGGMIDPDLEAILARKDPQEVVSALVYLRDQVDLDALTQQLDYTRASLKARHETVVRSLQEQAATTRGDLLTTLEAMKAQGTVKDFHAFWIANCVRVDAPSAVLHTRTPP